MQMTLARLHFGLRIPTTNAARPALICPRQAETSGGRFSASFAQGVGTEASCIGTSILRYYYNIVQLHIVSG